MRAPCEPYEQTEEDREEKGERVRTPPYELRMFDEIAGDRVAKLVQDDGILDGREACDRESAEGHSPARDGRADHPGTMRGRSRGLRSVFWLPDQLIARGGRERRPEDEVEQEEAPGELEVLEHRNRRPERRRYGKLHNVCSQPP